MSWSTTCVPRAIVLLIALLAAVRANAFDPVQNDLWDIRRGAIVTDASETEFYSPASNVFGGHNIILPEHGERFNTIFHDPAQGGQLFSVEWSTPAPVTVQSFVLNAAHDSGPQPDFSRAVSRFALYAFDDANGAFSVPLFELFPAYPYSGTPEVLPRARVEVTGPEGNELSLAANVTPTTAQRFRAEFTMAGDPEGMYLAPRIVELDGFPVPYEGIEVTTPGDANNDLVVDVADLNNVRNHFGEGTIQGPPVFGEAYPFDGRVDLGDLNLVRDYFGVSLQAVPEPSSLSVLMVSVALAAWYRMCGGCRRQSLSK